MHETRLKKFNGGKGAILCNKCRAIVKQGDGITKEDWESTEPLICAKCQCNEKNLTTFEECRRKR